MNQSAKVTSKGQITLPADVRRSLHLKPGDRVDFIRNDAGNFEIKARGRRLSDLRGIVKPDFPVTGEDIDRWIKEARAAGYKSDEE
jgi:AbrB family looped-hinge helix DNA binding protein